MSNNNNYSFPQKVWIAGGILAFIAVMLLLLRAVFSVLLLVLAGTLIAVFFRGLAGFIQRRTRWKDAICVTVSILGTLIILLLLLWLIGAKVTEQATELSDTLPRTVSYAKRELTKLPAGRQLIERLSSPEAQKQAQSVAKTFFKSTFGVLGDVYVILFIAIFFTVSPNIYRKGIVQLVPPAGKGKADAVLTKTGEHLTKWLKGQLFAMLVVFVLTAAGLAIIGVPMWLVLAIIAGILNFIPNFGPLISSIPAILVALMQGTSSALWVAGLYIVIQVAEGNFITPLVQQRLISIPPALIIIAQLLMAPLAGGWGLVLATPLLAIIMVFVQELYVSRQHEL